MLANNYCFVIMYSREIYAIENYKAIYCTDTIHFDELSRITYMLCNNSNTSY